MEKLSLMDNTVRYVIEDKCFNSFRILYYFPAEKLDDIKDQEMFLCRRQMILPVFRNFKRVLKKGELTEYGKDIFLKNILYNIDLLNDKNIPDYIKKITIANSYNLKDLKIENETVNTSSFKIYSDFSEIEFINSEILSDFRAVFKKLEKLTMDTITGIEELDFIKKAPLLKEISLHNIELKDLKKFRMFKNLQSVDLQMKKIDMDSLSNIAKLKNLKINEYSSDNNIEKTSFIYSKSGIIKSNINTLELNFIKEKELEFIEYFTKLKYLSFNQCYLTDLNFLKNMKNLKFLEINNCSYLKDISGLKFCKNLRFLFLKNLKIENLEWIITQNPSIKVVIYENCNHIYTKNQGFYKILDANSDYSKRFFMKYKKLLFKSV